MSGETSSGANSRLTVGDVELRRLPDLNGNYDPPRPWRCATLHRHACTGTVVGAVGAIPVCQAGAVAEHTAVVEARRRRQELADSQWAADEAAREHRLESRFS